MTSLVTVLLPVYNAGPYLPYAIESILSQTLTDFEFIIINDGSQDDSLKTIQHYAMMDERIMVVSRENKGLIHTLNEGIRLSNGRYIARMDQDDIALNHRLEVEYNYIIEHNLDVCGGDYIIINQSGKRGQLYHLFQKDFEILLCMASNVPFPHPSVMIKKEFLTSKGLDYGMNGYRQAEDLDLWLNMFNAGGKFGNVGEVILEYRILPTSMSRVNHKRMVEEADKQFDMFMNQNIQEFEKAFDTFLSNKESNSELQKVTIIAVLRYSFLKKNISVLYHVAKKVRFCSFLLGCLSFAKFKWSVRLRSVEE